MKKKKFVILIIILSVILVIGGIVIKNIGEDDKSKRIIKNEKKNNFIENLSYFKIENLEVEKLNRTCVINFDVKRTSYYDFDHDSAYIYFLDSSNNLIYKLDGSNFRKIGFENIDESFPFHYETEYDISKTVKVVLSSDKYPYKYNEDLTNQIKKVFSD